MKQRIKQYSFWTGLSAAVVILVTSLSKAFGFSFKEEIISDIIMAVCGVLVVFGVVNSPLKEEDKDTTTRENQNETEEDSEKK